MLKNTPITDYSENAVATHAHLKYEMKNFRDCYKLSLTDPENTLFTDPELLKTCNDREKGFLDNFFMELGPDLCDTGNVLTDGTLSIDGKKHELAGANAIKKFILDNYQSMYQDSDNVEFEYYIKDKSLTTDTLSDESQEFLQYFTSTYGECENFSNHNEL